MLHARHCVCPGGTKVSRNRQDLALVELIVSIKYNKSDQACLYYIFFIVRKEGEWGEGGKEKGRENRDPNEAEITPQLRTPDQQTFQCYDQIELRLLPRFYYQSSGPLWDYQQNSLKPCHFLQETLATSLH